MKGEVLENVIEDEDIRIMEMADHCLKKIREDGRKKDRKKQNRKQANNLKVDCCCIRSQNQGLYNVITRFLFCRNVTLLSSNIKSALPTHLTL